MFKRIIKFLKFKKVDKNAMYDDFLQKLSIKFRCKNDFFDDDATIWYLLYYVVTKNAVGLKSFSSKEILVAKWCLSHVSNVYGILEEVAISSPWSIPSYINSTPFDWEYVENKTHFHYKRFSVYLRACWDDGEHKIGIERAGNLIDYNIINDTLSKKIIIYVSVIAWIYEWNKEKLLTEIERNRILNSL